MSSARPTLPAPRLFAGPSEMHARMADLDWSATPVGPVERWPQSLRSTVRTLLASRYPMVLTWGPHFTQFYNDAYSQLIGDKHPAALGNDIRATLAEAWDTLGPMIGRVMATGAANWTPALPLLLERHGYREESYFSVSHAPAEDDEGQVVGMLAVCSEVTAQVLGERRLRLLRDLSLRAGEIRSVEQTSRDLIAALSGHPLDVPFALLYLRDAASQAATLRGVTGLEEEPPSLGDVLKAALGGETVLVEDIRRQVSLLGGLWRDPIRSALALPIASSGQTAPLGVLVAGVSPSRSLDEAYRSFFELLAGQASVALRNAQAHEEERRRAEQLAELDRAKTRFFSNVSHEFRTPLTLLLGPVEDMLADPDLAPTRRDPLAVVHRNALRLLRLVNTLLDFARVEADRTEAAYRPTDLAALTTDLASAFRSTVERAGMTLVVECPPLPEPVWVDRAMWEKVVLNLLSNAFKFTLAGSIAVRLRASEGHAELCVVDTGTGIPASELPRLFERFHRVEGASGRSFEGTGIGLALVQELVRLHGGSVSVESELGRGSAFRVSLPLGSAHLPSERLRTSPPEGTTAVRADAYVEEALRWLPDGGLAPRTGSPSAVPVQPLEAFAQAAAPARILVADDNADMRDYVQRLLGRHAVTLVANGDEALASALADPPDLIVSDVMMPGRDGFSLLRALRADERSRTIPVLLLSARAGEESRVEGLEAGADDYLAKPITGRELVARVESHLALARLRQEAATLRQREEQQRAVGEALREANEALTRSNRELEQFAYSASHDLQEPLRVMTSYAQLISRRYRGRLDDSADEFIGYVVDAARRMQALIDDLLAYSRVLHGPNTPEERHRPVPLDEVLTATRANLQALMTETGATVEARPLPVVLGDPVQLGQVFQNLLGNAIKYRREGVPPRILVSAERQGEEWVVSVADNGIGFLPEHAERIFGLFKRLHGRAVPGTGIGLAICRQIVERHGGRIWAETPGEGSGATFSFSLPAGVVGANVAPERDRELPAPAG